MAPEINDVAFVGTVHPEHGPVSTSGSARTLHQPDARAQKLGAWILPDEVPDAWAGVAGLFRDYGLPPAALAGPPGFLGGRDWGME